MNRIHILLVVSLALPLAGRADGIPIEPGLWEMTSTMSMPMLPQPRVNTVTECIRNSEISMDDFNVGEMDPRCTFIPAQVDGNTMRWSFDCPVEGGTSHGEWRATSNGDSVNGDGLVSMSIQGQTMEMKMIWEGKRIGVCP